MKKILLPLAIIAVIFCSNACKTAKTASSSSSSDQAAKPARIVLSPGQKITVTGTSTSDIDLGMGQIQSNTVSTNIINVVSSGDTNYTLTNSLTKLKITTDAMGQQTNYDSEKPEDKDNEIGKIISKKLNVPATYEVDKMKGTITSKTDSTDISDDVNPFAELISSMGGSGKDATLDGTFFIVPLDKKTGDSWVDSLSEKNIKTVKTYTLQSIDNNIATISLKGAITGTGEAEMQGTSMTFTMNTTSKGVIIVNTKTSLVQKVTSDSDVNLSMDVMGQTMPLTGKVSSSITYQ